MTSYDQAMEACMPGMTSVQHAALLIVPWSNIATLFYTLILLLSSFNQSSTISYCWEISCGNLHSSNNIIEIIIKLLSRDSNGYLFKQAKIIILCADRDELNKIPRRLERTAHCTFSMMSSHTICREDN